MINLIMAVDRNYLIGRGDKLPWSLPNDLKYFRKVTEGKIVAMGRKTYESLGCKPLKNRKNAVITTNKKYDAKDDSVYIEQVETVLLASLLKPDMEIFIIGGAEIFKQFEELAERIYITQIDAEFEGDIYYKPNLHGFYLEKQIPGVVDSKNKYPHIFKIYKRKG